MSGGFAIKFAHDRVKSIFKDEFDPRIGNQGLLFYFWALPQYYVMSNVAYGVCAFTMFPALGLFFSFAPTIFLNNKDFNEYYEQKTLPGIGKLVS